MFTGTTGNDQICGDIIPDFDLTRNSLDFTRIKTLTRACPTISTTGITGIKFDFI